MLRLVYAGSVLLLSQLPWLTIFMGTEMRIDVIANVLAAGVIAAGVGLRRPALLLAGAALGLGAVLRPVAAAGWQSALVLPWARSLTAVVTLAQLGRLRAGWLIAAVLFLAYVVALVAARGWAAVDYAIALFATLLAMGLLDLAWPHVRGLAGRQGPAPE